MRHSRVSHEAREAIRRLLIWLLALFACFTGSAILTRERDWRYMLLMTSPYLALFFCLIGLAFIGWLKRRKERERLPSLSPDVVAAAQEKFNAVRTTESSANVRSDNADITIARNVEPSGANLGSSAPNESSHRDSLYAKVLAATAWLWLLAALPFLTDAACHFVAAMVLAVAWMFLAFVWLCGLLLARSLLRSSPARYWWLSAGLAGLLGLLLAFTDVGFTLRVALSERALNAYVATVPPGCRNSMHRNRRVGLFLVDGTEESNGVVVLYTSSSVLDRHGIAFVPDGTILPSHLSSVKHLFGSWYSFRWKF